MAEQKIVKTKSGEILEVLNPKCPKCGAHNDKVIFAQSTNEYGTIGEVNSEGSVQDINIVDSEPQGMNYIQCDACNYKWESEFDFSDDVMEKAKEEDEKAVATKTIAELKSGLKDAVTQYIFLRKQGDSTEAKRMRDHIDGIVKEKGLNRDMVFFCYGNPDDPNVREDVYSRAAKGEIKGYGTNSDAPYDIEIVQAEAAGECYWTGCDNTHEIGQLIVVLTGDGSSMEMCGNCALDEIMADRDNYIAADSHKHDYEYWLDEIISTFGLENRRDEVEDRRPE